MNAAAQRDVFFSKELLERTRLSDKCSVGNRWLPDGFIVDLSWRPLLPIVIVTLMRPGRRIAPPPPQSPQGMDSEVPSLFPVYPSGQHHHQAPTVVLRLEASLSSEYPQVEGRWRILEPAPHEVSFRPNAIADMASAMQMRSNAVDSSRVSFGADRAGARGESVLPSTAGTAASVSDALESGRRGGSFLRDLLLYVDWWSNLFVDEQNTAAGSSTLWHATDMTRGVAALPHASAFRTSEVLSDSETGSLVVPLAAGQRTTGDAGRGAARASAALFHAVFSAGGNIIMWNLSGGAILPMRRTQSSATIAVASNGRSQRLVNVDSSMCDGSESNGVAGHRLPRSRRCHTMDDIAVTSGATGRAPPGSGPLRPGPTSPVFAFVGRSFSAAVLLESAVPPQAADATVLQSGVHRTNVLHHRDEQSSLPQQARGVPLAQRAACVFAAALPVPVFLSLPLQTTSSPRRAVAHLSAILASERANLPDAWKVTQVCVPLLAALGALLPEDCGSSHEGSLSDLGCIGLWHTLISPALRATVRHLVCSGAPVLAGAVVTCTLLPILSWTNQREAATLCTAMVALLSPLVVYPLVNALLHLCEVTVTVSPTHAAAVRHVAEWIAVQVGQGSLLSWERPAAAQVALAGGSRQIVSAKDPYRSSHPLLSECAVCSRRLQLPARSSANYSKTERRGDAVLQCVLCGHGGHYDHITEWWAAGDLHRLCPDGCGCACSY